MKKIAQFVHKKSTTAKDGYKKNVSEMLKMQAKTDTKGNSGAEETRTLYLIAARDRRCFLRVRVESHCLKEKAKKRPSLLAFLCFACQCGCRQ